MMKKICFLVLLIIIPIAFASYETKIYSGWVETKKNLTLGEDNFKFNWIRDQNRTIVFLPDGSVMQINPEFDVCSTEGFYRICQTKQKFYLKGKEVPPDITSEINASLYLYINKTDQGLSITKEYIKEIYKNYPTKVKIVISKLPNTKEQLLNIELAENYSNDFKITNVLGCKKEGNEIRYKIDVFQSRFVCEYDLLPLKSQSYTSITTLKYGVFGKKHSKSLENKMVIKESPIVFSIDYPKHNKIGDRLNLSISYSVQPNVEIESLKISIPRMLSVEKYPPSLKLEDSNLILQDKNIAAFEITLNSSYEGINKLEIDHAFVVNGQKSSGKNTFNINYSAYIFDVEFFKKDNKTIIRISNSDITEYYNIILIADENQFSLEKLGKRSFKEFIVEDPKNISVVYKTEYGQKINKDIVKQEVREYIKEAKIDENKTDNKKEAFKFEFDTKIIIYVFCALIIVVLLLIFIIKSPKKSSLDKEISDLQKTNFK